MKKFIATLTAILFSLGPAWANDTLDRVRVLLDAGDVTSLQSALEEIHNDAQANSDFSVLRQINRRLFATTHPARRETITKWEQTFPRSPFASAAVTWFMLHEARQWTGSYRTGADGPTIEARRMRLEVSKAAMERADLGFSRSPHYIGSADAWLTAYLQFRYSPKHRAKARIRRLKVSTTLMTIQPDQDSLQLIVSAAVERSGDPAFDVDDVCSRFGALVAGHTAESCFAEASVNHYLAGEYREVARQFLQNTENPTLAQARLKAELQASRDEGTIGDAETLIQMHLNGLRPDTDFEQFRRDAGIIMGRFDRLDYPATADAHLLEMLNELLVDDPLNALHLVTKSNILHDRFKTSGEATDLTSARAAWEGAGMYARFHGQFWMLGAELVAADRSEMDVVPQLEFRNNAIAYSEQSAMSIFHSLYRIHQARTAAQEALEKGTVADLSEVNAILELTRCPYLRAARTVDALCRLHGFSSGGPCNPDKPLRKMAASALVEGSAGLCPSVSEAQLSDLKYNAVPLEEIAIPWKN